MSRLAPWRVEGSRAIVKDRWIDLRAERCVTERGAVLDPYYVLHYSDWVHVAAFDAEDRLVFVRQYRHGSRSLSLELPGGVMDAHESDPLVTGARELLEETGHTAATFAHLARLSPNPAHNANAVHLILAMGAKAVKAPEFDETEDIVVERIPWREAMAMAMAGEMIHAAHVGLLAMAVARTKGLRFGT